MSTIVWTTLIAAVATVTASLGVVLIKGHYDDRIDVRKAEEARAAEVRKAKETSVAEVSGRRREAYAQLLTTARKALQQARLRQETVERKGKIDDPYILSADDLAQVVALAELLGSPQSNPHVQAIYNNASDLNHLYYRLAKAPESPDPGTPGETVSDSSPPRPDAATALTSELEKAIKAFVKAVRSELGD